MVEKLFGQPHGPQWKSNDLLDVSLQVVCQFTASATKIHQQQRPRASAQVGDYTKMDEAALFQAGGDFDLPSGGGAHPFREDASIVAVAHGAGGHDADAVYRIALGSPVKTPQHLERVRHGLRIKAAVTKDTFAQPGNFAILMKRNEPGLLQFSNAQADGIGTDIDSGKNRHSLALMIYRMCMSLCPLDQHSYRSGGTRLLSGCVSAGSKKAGHRGSCDSIFCGHESADFFQQRAIHAIGKVLFRSLHQGLPVVP